MALPLDRRRLAMTRTRPSYPDAPGATPGTTPPAGPAVPEETPLAMPRHGVHAADRAMRRPRASWACRLGTLFARWYVLTVTMALSLYGVTEMYGVLSTNSVTLLQWLFFVLFGINFAWIAFAFAQASLGFLIRLKPRLIRPPEIDAPFKTAILLPIYNEDPLRVRAGIQAMRADLRNTAPGQFAFFILSDTNRAEAWIAEEAAFLDLVDHATPDCPVYYRHRSHNAERKAGNIADWVQRWGGAYGAMIVLDADSTMSAGGMRTLARRLAAAPAVGLIQTLPAIVRAHTVYGRLQQFANHCFGPIYAEGLSAWHGWSSNFWGHNAIIRTRAFAASCGLPVLAGKPPMGGHVLSHDFIEAALLRRAGWGVRLDTDIEGSFEEAPPSLIDVLVRDRRWCQGNLQHSRFLFARGLALPTRLHLLSGVMAYLSAVFWLALIVVGLAIAVQASLVRPEYFTNPSLFPTWPVFDAERALRLFGVSMGIVLAPKVFGWLTALLQVRRWRPFGGPILLTLNTALETLASALYAPVLMVSQFGVVTAILRGKDSGWTPQSRDSRAASWTSAAGMHWRHTVFGGVVAALAMGLSRELFYWLLPVTAGLVLSIPLSWLSGNRLGGICGGTVGVLRAPEEKHPHPILAALRHALAGMPLPEPASALDRLIDDPRLCAWHIAQLRDGRPHAFHAPSVTAEWKVRHTADPARLASWLDPDETLALLSSRECIERLIATASREARPPASEAP